MFFFTRILTIPYMANDLSQGKYRDKAGRERFHGTPALKKSQHFGLDHSIYIALYIVLLLLDIYSSIYCFIYSFSPLLDTAVPGAILMASGRISAKRGSSTWALVLAEGISDSNPSHSNQCVSGPSLTWCLWKICGKMQSYGNLWAICSIRNDWGQGMYNRMHSNFTLVI